MKKKSKTKSKGKATSEKAKEKDKIQTSGNPGAVIVGIVIVIAVLAFIGFVMFKPIAPGDAPRPTGEKLQSLDEVLTLFDRLDQEHNTSWHDEILGGQMVSMAKADVYLTELKSYMPSTETLRNLMNARIGMIESERAFQKIVGLGEKAFVIATNVGNGTFKIDTPLNCADAPILQQSTELYRDVFNHGTAFSIAMDYTLQSSPEAQEKIGLGEARPNFYNFALGSIFMQFNINRAALAQFCGVEIEKIAETFK